MRILVYGLNYTPELTGIGKYTGEMTEWLAAQGHEVRVVTALPYYPAWRVDAGFSPWRYCTEFLKDIKVWRCPLWVPHKPSGLKRILHLASFAIASFPVVLWQGLNWQPDVVFVVEPAFFCVVGALVTSRVSGAKAWLHIQDLEIDAGFDLGLLPSSGIVRSLITTIERWLTNRFDRVSTISERMLERLKLKGILTHKCVYFPNWVDTTTIYPLQHASALRAELGIEPDTFVALYSGSMGEKQGLEVILAAAQMLATDYPNILFVLCGEGSARKHLQKSAKKMPNVRFLNLQPVHRLNDLLNLANVHLLPQLPTAADLVMPSKLQGMCASGRPAIATVHPGTQIAQVLQSCGMTVIPGDITALTKALVILANHPEQCIELGKAARQFTLNNWQQEKVLQQLEQKFYQLCFTPNVSNKRIDAALEQPLESDS